ncbi:Fc.00g017530.m01.CDS01 [Cosmosporella sp. VM-42]
MRRALNVRLAAQAMTLKVSANLVVQFLHRWESWQDPKQPSIPFDWQQVLEFAMYGLFGSQIGNIVQFILEDWFPTRNAPVGQLLPDTLGQARHLQQLQDEKKQKQDDVVVSDGTTGRRWLNSLKVSPDVSWRNVLAKLVLDQTLGLFISGSVFLICTNIARVTHPLLVVPVIRERIWTLIKAGWHIWPLVAICNFLWVPVRSRVLVAVFVGFGWSIFLSVFAARRN